MPSGWTADETRALLGVWGEADVQSQLDGICRNRTIYQKIAATLHEMGHEKSWQQCRTKIKNMVVKYRKAKDSNDISGRGRTTCPFYEELNNVLGTRAASSPPILLDSGTSQQQTEDEATVTAETATDELEMSLQGSTYEQCCSYIDESASPTHYSTPASVDTGNSSNRKEMLTARKRGQKRKRSTVDEGIVEIMREMEERYKEREMAREEKWLKLEREMEEMRGQREKEQDERMQYMFGTFFNQMLTMSSSMHSFPYPPQQTPPYPPQQTPLYPPQQTPSYLRQMPSYPLT